MPIDDERPAEGAAPPPEAALPPEFDEAMFAAEIEAEFERIKADIDRINMMDRKGGPTKRVLLQQFRERRRVLRNNDPNRPEWRVRLDALLEDAMDSLVADGLREQPDGTLALALNSQIVGTHGVPIITAMLDGLRESVLSQADKGGFMGAFGPRILQFIDNFRTSFAGASPPGVEPAPVAPNDATEPQDPPKPSPSAGLSFDDLLKGFKGVIEHAKRQPPPAPKTSAKGKGGKDAHPKPGKAQTTRVSFGTPPPKPAAPGQTAQNDSGAAPKAGPTVNIDFAGLLGSLLQSVTAPKPQRQPPAATPNPSPPPDTTTSAPTATPTSAPNDAKDPEEPR